MESSSTKLRAQCLRLTFGFGTTIVLSLERPIVTLDWRISIEESVEIVAQAAFETAMKLDLTDFNEKGKATLRGKMMTAR